MSFFTLSNEPAGEPEADNHRGVLADSKMPKRVLLVGTDRAELTIVRSAVEGDVRDAEVTVLDQVPTRQPAPPFGIAIMYLDKASRGCRQTVQLIKSRLDVPVLVLTPLPRPDQIAAMMSCLPADDIAFLPVRPEEVEARVRFLFEKAERQATMTYPLIERRRANRPVQRVADSVPRAPSPPGFVINDREKQVRIGERSIRLSPTEYRLTVLLASDPGRVFSPREIASHLWPGRSDKESDLPQYIRLLRRKIEKDPSQPEWLLNQQGFGYKLDIPG